MGYAHSREEPDHRVHVGAGFAGWRAVCRCQVPAEGHSGTVAWRCGPKSELSSFRLYVLARTKASPCSPKLQNRNDPNLSMVPGDHPFIDAASLEVEGATLLRRLITDFLYTKQYVGSVVNRNLTNVTRLILRPFQKPGPYIRHTKQLVKSHQAAAWLRPGLSIFPHNMDTRLSRGPSLC